MSLKLIKKLKSPLYAREKVIFFADFETALYNNKHYVTCFVISSEFLLEPYCSVISYTKDSDIQIESQNLLTSFIEKLLELSKEIKDKEILIYFHNLGKFDGLFLINFLSTFPSLKLNVITRDNTFYEIKVSSNDVEFKFRDSFLLFPLSLEKIALLFNDKKTTFSEIAAPFERYSDNVFRHNILEYCKQDVKILQKALIWYSNYIQINYKINIYSCLTLSSLSFKIYRTHFYTNSLIHQSHGFMDEFIRKSYRGGIVDVYKPILENGYYYDVNSLYPYVMSVSDMPVGPGTQGKVDSTASFNINDFFGFISVKVKAPKFMYIPFLAFNHKISGLTSPLGEWTGVYFSEEIKYALTLGYEFEYYSYYKFDKKNVFFNFVTSLYNERVQNKDKPELSGVLKLLLNSLYGRFGMSNSVYKNLFLKNTRKDKELLKKINLLYDTEIVSTFKNLSTNKQDILTLIRYNEIPNLDHITNLYKRGFLSDKVYKTLIKEPEKKTGDLNVSVHIASAITAYARIYMHKIKNQYKDHLYYSDTDSLIVDTPISDDLISSTQIGLFKLEHKIKKGIFIAPKLYYMDSGDIEIMKSKGINSNLLSYEDFLHLYKENPVKLRSFKNFLRDLKTSTIGVSEQDIELKGIFSKRLKVFDSTGKWIDTLPLSISE